jgi:hypothetical protein
MAGPRMTQLELDEYYRKKRTHESQAIEFVHDSIAACPVEAGREAQLQRDCENLLSIRGYMRRTPDNMTRTPMPRKWFLHYQGKRAKGVPIIMDLLILVRGRFLEVELKAATTRIAPHQRTLINSGQAQICHSVADFKRILDGWEDQHND